MYTIYVIKSLTKIFTYVGFTNNLERRLTEHNLGYNNSTKSYRPFELVYTEAANTSSEARNREKFLKSGKGREFLKQLSLDKVPARHGG
jgi:putative endonuclease